VVKAIQKAWEASGMPLEFTINVHEVGERNFLGFSKHPAIVSIAYDPRKVQQTSVLGKKGDTRSQGQSGQRPDARQNFNKGQKPRVEVKPKLSPEKDRGLAAHLQAPQQPRVQVKPEGLSTPEPEQWTQEMANDVREWLKETLVHVGIATPFNLEFDRRMLTVTFDTSVMPTPDEERQLFIGLSYILMQFLKKKCKKKLRGHHLVFNSKYTPSSTPAA